MKTVRVITFILLSVFLQNNFIHAKYPNEKLDYKIRYGFINAGNVSFVTQKTTFSGKEVYHTKVDARTTGLIDQLYKLHDIFESYYDVKTGLPHFSITNLSEGKYRYYNENTYNHSNFSVHSSRRDTTFYFEHSVFDVISALCHFRTLDWSKLAIDDMIELQTFHQDAFAPMFVVYKGIENVSIGNFVYRCHKFTPVIDPGKIFQKRENMIIWFSDDKNKIPISIRLNLMVGSFRLELEKYENLLYPFTAKIK